MQDTSLPADNSPLVWYRLQGLSVCVPARCGSTSFEMAVGRQDKFEKPARGKAYLAVRDPVDRFISLWRFCNDPVRRPCGMAELRGTPEHMMDIIEQFPMVNRHWIPQATYWQKRVVCVPYQRLLRHLGYHNRIYNKSRAVAPLSVPEDRIVKHYQDDLELLHICHLANPSPIVIYSELQ